MTTLIITDLSVTEQLDARAMTAVRGGMYKGVYPFWSPLVSVSKNDFQFEADQALGQSQNTMVNNGNNVAFASGITSTVKPHQHGANTINFA
ncbi:hypothetical protein [Noviherbaspirillum saxi]|uniref:Uncharacterized protein n=1 Tax=Noviherbaspirillum saxi TaxID=2320863 RepID=A0A3A3FL70_9BURK|nr:hypothetical protein [Noviherbaspirillum saxi]RJF96047.1 hypothetical protein D3871_22165 [Noviherbaspirillum saxi]RJF96054.1 hypothetical protein D3871_22200 [Noviherbaspirillum saxi]